MNNNFIQLSPSSLSVFMECPKCFWLQKIRGIHRPKQIFALQNNFDKIIKSYFDQFRCQEKLPPEIDGKVEGKLFNNSELLTSWQNALNPALVFKHPNYPNFSLSGGIDDCLISGDFYIPIDFKTTGSSNFNENSEKYYQHQLDIYSFLLEKNGYKTKRLAYLVYYKPEEVISEGIIKFQIVVKKMETNHDRAINLFEKGIALLSGPMPKSHSECQFCSWGNDFLS